ncbi:NAD(P)/FAD-dependent oxidoreductase [Sanguibacter sp. 25GB23B1]|uniref:NAD(P)/FAD-dependent oxidoreductase n=1 Tax=unclassified Sanguibacter TaxID=2645534 RepID=UPI0032AEE685
MHLTHPPETVPSAGPASVLVVGAGLAGAQTVAALRKHGCAGRLTVLGDEGVLPYDRPPLSKELFSRPEPAWISDELGVDLEALADEVVLDDAAVSLVVGEHATTVTTARGRRLTAEVVVLACGAEPVRPAGWEHALSLHSAQDAAILRESLRPGARLVCVGAGWIGAEVAGAAVGAGCRVSVVEAASVPLDRQLGEQVGSLVAPWYADAGVELVVSSAVTGVAADGVRLRSDDGTERLLSADVVLAAVGARPATDWLRGAVPMDARGSIAADASGRVRTGGDLAAVYAVGDCATREDPVWEHVPGGHWSAALLDPDRVARAVLGLVPEDATAPAPYVFSRQLGHDIALFGLPDPVVDRVVVRGEPSVPGAPWSALYVAPHGLVTGILVVDSPREVGAARRLMANGPVALDLDRAVDARSGLLGARLADGSPVGRPPVSELPVSGRSDVSR